MIGGVPGTTDGTILTRDAGLATVVYGPGGKWIAHQADEYVEVDDILTCTRAYIAAARHFLRRPMSGDDRRRDGRGRTAQLADRRRRASGSATTPRSVTASSPAPPWCSAPDGGMVAGVDVRGGGPATHETDLLEPDRLGANGSTRWC